jgi:hypothetical protein
MMLPLEDYYFLLHAFDRLGRRLFPQWRGDEIAQRCIDPPEVVAAAREPHETRIKEIYAEHDKLEAINAKITDEAKTAANKQTMKGLLEERTGLMERLLPMAQLNEAYHRERANYERRVKTEQLFFGALKSGALRAQLLAGPYVDWPAWSREHGFKCYLALSLVVVPRRQLAMRRGTALIRRTEFEAWLRSATPPHPAARAKMTAEDKFAEWLEEFIRKNDGKKPMDRRSIFALARAEIEGLSGRACQRAWPRFAPPDWRKRGAPPGR